MPLLILIGVLMIITEKGFQFNLDANKYREYYDIAGLKLGSWEKYHSAQKIYVNSAMMSQRIYSRVSASSTFTNQVFNAYLKLDDDNKLHLKGMKNKEKLLKKLEPLCNAFGLEVVDNTNG
ncbi:hypothetical protein [Fulvivirga ligni]|uniref:hypothetical protein n=1 Tax=Fulvivirga ligni TaxID=2904246 RepID=UPI001F376C47|nr:hypothetical protein [Fulvivirga ligni]UII19173.1 hypothetical protein LVD16_15110 [Fulvivirga ligni]